MDTDTHANAADITAAEDAPDLTNAALSDLFVDSFWPLMKAFRIPPERLKQAFEPSFNRTCFAVAMEGGELLAMAALAGKKEKPFSFVFRHAVKTLGVLSGTMLFFVLSRALDTGQYPVEHTDRTGYIEYVATAAAARGRGLAGAVIRHLIDHSDFDTYVLEVAGNNSAAKHTYERLGFRTVASKRAGHTKHTGIEHFDYMVYRKRA